MYNIKDDLPLYLADLTTYLQSKYGSMQMPSKYKPENHLRNNYFYYIYDRYPKMPFKPYLELRGLTIAIPRIKNTSSFDNLSSTLNVQHLVLTVTGINPIEGLSKKARELRELHMQMYPEYFL